MIIGIGCDIIEIARIASAIENKRFVERVYTSQEQGYCKSRGAQAASSYAARFGAKEAVLKALGTGLRDKGTLLDIEVVNDELGKPSVQLFGYFQQLAQQQGVKNIYLSLSHDRERALAYCVMEG